MIIKAGNKNMIHKMFVLKKTKIMQLNMDVHCFN